MHILNLAQDPTPISDEAVVQVVEQVGKALDIFNDLGVFMVVLLAFVLLIGFTGVIVLIVVLTGRKGNAATVDVLSMTNADKIKEVQEMRQQHREEMALERSRQQQNHDQNQQSREEFKLMFVALMSKTTESAEAVTKVVRFSESNILRNLEMLDAESRKKWVLFAKVLTTSVNLVFAEPPDPDASVLLKASYEALQAEQKQAQENLEAATDNAPTTNPTEAIP